jgi:hypothetical protein
MSESRPSSGPAPSTRPTWIVVGILLAAGTVVPLLVGIYDTEAPSVGGFPFFYWFQFLLIPIVSALTFVAFRLSESATARDRATRRATRRAHGRPGGAE